MGSVIGATGGSLRGPCLARNLWIEMKMEMISTTVKTRLQALKTSELLWPSEEKVLIGWYIVVNYLLNQ